MRRDRLRGLLAAVMGVLALLSTLSEPRVAALRGVDIVRLIASGMCFGVAFVALIGRLKLQKN